jgi:hypothetical protein
MEQYDMTSELSTTSQRMKIPLSLQDGLYSWSEERYENPKKHRKSRAYKVA